MLTTSLHSSPSPSRDAAKPGGTERASLRKHPYEMMGKLGLLKDSCPGHVRRRVTALQPVHLGAEVWEFCQAHMCC